MPGPHPILAGKAGFPRVASRRTPLRLVAAVAAVAALACGCATVPTVGRPERVTGAGGQAQQFVQPIPPVPNGNWKPAQIVQGFLAASASVTNNHAAARRFLSPQLRRNFQPSWAVTVVGSQLSAVQRRVSPGNLKGQSGEVATVSLTGQQLATISNIGQYLDSPGSRTYQFKLARIDNQWLITDLPPALLLTQSDFEQVYQPRNLYFWAPSGQSLVPEPVFAPEQHDYAAVATNLVHALLMTNQDATSWLAAATTTAFPDGTTLLGGVSVAGSTAVVNLGGAAAAAGSQQRRRMAAQLVTTLTSTSYQQPPISRSVVLEINGRTQYIGGERVQQPVNYPDLAPSSAAAESAEAPLYFIGSTGAVSLLTRRSAHQVAGPMARAHIRFAAIAVSRAGPPQLAGTLAAGPGCVVYYGALAGTAPLGHRALPGGLCTSLSWDSLGDIWAVNAQRTWVLSAGSRQPAAVSLPPLPGGNPAAYRVLSLRIAPDGVRAAMLVQTTGKGAHQEVLLTAVTRTDSQISLGPTVTIGTSLTAPAALSWYDPDHLILLAGSQLYEVPVNGGAVVPLGPVPPGTQSVTSAGPGQIATTGHNQILTSTGPDEIQQPTAAGTSPAYPG
jgi:Lipoprotein LpqB beta-propeller domain/Sporulation and spore germination